MQDTQAKLTKYGIIIEGVVCDDPSSDFDCQGNYIDIRVDEPNGTIEYYYCDVHGDVIGSKTQDIADLINEIPRR